MPRSCIEPVVYTVKDARDAGAARRAVRPLIEKLPGFLAWRAVTATDDGRKFADVAMWGDEAAAKAASAAVQKEAAFAPFMEQIETIVSYGHYA
jgi:heme-degrading monooxygenase HmoA